ncbi:MAG: SagB/ThcOx family dehydrogenase, partial [Deltaproteobacteria bacterium]|nr:SagB/ThcOx family dehydrogenase [Deltaproteobacteria bacterium]
MKKICFLLLISVVVMTASSPGHPVQADEFSLPQPSYKGSLSVEQALKARRTQRSFQSRPLALEQLSQILWAAYGVTKKIAGHYLKTAPSAGALYPLDIYAVIGKKGVRELIAGVYHFLPRDHRVEMVKQGDYRSEVGRLSAQQMWIAEAPLILVITGEYGRSTVKYGRRGV